MHRPSVIVILAVAAVLATTTFATEEERVTHRGESTPSASIPIEQELLHSARRYHLWRHQHRGAATLLTEEGGDSLSQSLSQQQLSMDTELLSRIQEDSDAPIPQRTIHQQRRWLRQQREEALSSRPVVYHHNVHDRVVYAPHWAQAQQQRRQASSSLLELPSTEASSSQQDTAGNSPSMVLVTFADYQADEGTPLPTRTKELKQFLRQRGADCPDCVELRDLVHRAEVVRHVPTHDDLVVAEMSAKPFFAINSYTDRAEQLMETIAELSRTSPQAAVALNQAIAARAYVKTMANCGGDDRIDWLGNFNSTLPEGCSVAATAMVQ